VRQPCDGARLSLEPRTIGAEGEELDDDAAVELGIVREPDFRHRGLTQPFVKAVAAGQR
jgi:hypothetical protein